MFDNVKNVGIVLFWIGVLVLGAVSSVHYPGSVWIYIAFTVVSNLLIYIGFREKAIFFDAFIGVLLWLGFWLKYSIHISFMDGYFKQAHGTFNGSSAAASDNVLLISSCGLSAFVLASLVRSHFIFNYPKPNNGVTLNTKLVEAYSRYRWVIVAAFVFFVLGVTVSNAWLGVYQRGEVPRTVLPYGLGGIYAWLLLFGMASFAAVVLHCEHVIQRGNLWLGTLVVLFEGFASSVSLLSRGMVLNVGSVFYGLLRSVRYHRVDFKLRFYVIIALAFSVLFVTSVLLVNYLRINLVNPETTVSVMASNDFTKITDLVIDRWVGVEGVMAVANYPNQGWGLWRSAWSERYDVHKTSFFDLNLIDTPYKKTDTRYKHSISLPGIIAFFFYPGSYLFLFSALFCIGLIAAVIELSAYRLGGNNLILTALIAQVVAYRLTSFGYVPNQSYLLFGAIFLNLVLIWSVRWLAGYQMRKKGEGNSNAVRKTSDS